MPPNPIESTYDEKKQDYCETAEDSDSLDVDSAAEQRLVRKLDLRLLPCLALTYLLAFLDVRPVSLRSVRRC
jgi:hypothetical protein